jgi:hypothetical protein
MKVCYVTHLFCYLPLVHHIVIALNIEELASSRPAVDCPMHYKRSSFGCIVYGETEERGEMTRYEIIILSHSAATRHEHVFIFYCI